MLRFKHHSPVITAATVAILTTSKQRRQRIAHLEAIAGEPNKAGHYSNAVVYLPGLRIQNNYHLDNEHNISAEISVKRWETLVMIARLVAEDHQLDASKASP